MGVDTAANARSGERQHNAIRGFVSTSSVLGRADGSARWRQEGTSVLVAVYGPQQGNSRKEDFEKAIIEVVFKPESGKAGCQEHEYEYYIRECLEGIVLTTLHPRTSILVVCQVERQDGALLACTLNACCMALVDAGIPMRRMFASLSVALHASEDTTTDGLVLMLDPDKKEEERAQAVVTLAYPYRHHLPEDGIVALQLEDHVLLSHTCGVVPSVVEFMDVLDLARKGCERIAAVVNRRLS